ncbi:MAG: NAD(P)/FAD-dependent oxidoreductase, partial [Bacilli bacterium]|nr:NAD(P)/FAD-dependent oxidoreductase [Bacilli bacterium]
MKLYDILVIGGGPSGMSAALYALRSGKSVLILEKENFGGQIANSPRVENFPSIKEISGLDFSDHLFTQITDLGAEFELEEVLEVIKNDDKTFTVKT